jgi:hypothetical protein
MSKNFRKPPKTPQTEGQLEKLLSVDNQGIEPQSFFQAPALSLSLKYFMNSFLVLP